MCRTKTEGGRRCPSCASGRGRDAHNQRRRHNRAVRVAVASWAQHDGAPDGFVALLRAVPPSIAKQWAIDRDAPASVVDHPVAVDTRDLPGRHALREDTSWVSPQLLGQIGAAMRGQGAHEAEARLLDGVPTGLYPVGALPSSGYASEEDGAEEDGAEDAGVNETSLVTLDDGQVAFHKPFSGLDDWAADVFGHDEPIQPLHEVAAWRLAAGMGRPWDRLVPPCVLRDAAPHHLGLGSFARGVDGDVGTYPFDPEAGVGTQADAAGLFDCLIGQQDRHLHNQIVDASKLWLIDHGFAFARPGDRKNVSLFVDWRRYNGDAALSGYELATLDRLLGSRDWFGLAGMLQPARLTALVRRAEVMRQTGRLLPPGRGF